MSAIRVATSAFAALLLLAAPPGCSGTRPAGASAPAPAANAAVPDDPATGVPAVPDCTELGHADSEVVGGLQAEILLFRCVRNPAGLLLNGRLTNVSDAPTTIFTMPLRYPMLVFEVRDATGATVPGGPPPVPPVDEPSFHLELTPNADYSFDAAFADVVAIDLAPGTYQIRFAYGNEPATPGDWTGRVATGWVSFEVPAAP
jgi:hypothetical protein